MSWLMEWPLGALSLPSAHRLCLFFNDTQNTSCGSKRTFDKALIVGKRFSTDMNIFYSRCIRMQGKRLKELDVLPGHYAWQPSVSRRAKGFLAPVPHAAGEQTVFRKIMMFVFSRKLHKSLPQPGISWLF